MIPQSTSAFKRNRSRKACWLPPSLREPTFINGEKQSGQTPLTLPLPPGKYNVVLRLQGYDAYSGSVQVRDDSQMTVEACTSPEDRPRGLGAGRIDTARCRNLGGWRFYRPTDAGESRNQLWYP